MKLSVLPFASFATESPRVLKSRDIYEIYNRYGIWSCKLDAGDETTRDGHDFTVENISKWGTRGGLHISSGKRKARGNPWDPASEQKIRHADCPRSRS